MTSQRKTQCSEEKQCVYIWYRLVTTTWAAALPLSCHIPKWDPETPGVDAVCWEEMKMLLLAFWDPARWQSDMWVRRDVAANSAFSPLTWLSSSASEGLEDMLNFLLLKMKLRPVLRCFVNQDWISSHVLLSYCLRPLNCC